MSFLMIKLPRKKEYCVSPHVASNFLQTKIAYDMSHPPRRIVCHRHYAKPCITKMQQYSIMCIVFILNVLTEYFSVLKVSAENVKRYLTN